MIILVNLKAIKKVIIYNESKEESSEKSEKYRDYYIFIVDKTREFNREFNRYHLEDKVLPFYENRDSSAYNNYRKHPLFGVVPYRESYNHVEYSDSLKKLLIELDSYEKLLK